ncbi:MAG TPA: hypothetical protein VEY51_13825 [Chondromyces sp.]|nr:hypothetical protein [Chondromyces sp.]
MLKTKWMIFGLLSICMMIFLLAGQILVIDDKPVKSDVIIVGD